MLRSLFKEGLLKIKVQYFLHGRETKNPLGLKVRLLHDLERSTGTIILANNSFGWEEKAT